MEEVKKYWIDYEEWKALREWYNDCEQHMSGYAVKRDLIGTEWKCPRCGDIEIVTSKGVEHYRPDHLERETLDILFFLKRAVANLTRKLYNGR